MRILYSHRIQSHDGQSVHIEEMVGALSAAGHEVLVVGPSFYARSGFGAESRAVTLARRLLPASLAELAELAYNIPAARRLVRAASWFSPELIYERYNLHYLAGAWLARRRRVPFYLEVNAPLADERSRFGGLGLGRLARAAERRVWRAADRVFAVTSELGRRIAAEAVPMERIVITPNAVDPARFLPRPAARENGALVLGFIGFALQPRALPYASPLKLFEYMAAGCAIVAPDQPNIREIVVHEESALLFDPGQPEAMWQAIARLAADPALRLRLGAAARAEILRRDFTWTGNAARVIALAEADLARR